MSDTNRMPTIDTTERLIHGSILKCIDGRWSVHDTKAEMPTGTRMLALHTTRALQRWENQEPVETIVERPDEALPDVEELNAAIPQSQWEMDLNGQPRPPWQKQYVIYLLDPSTASLYTFLNSTVGARIAWEKLRERVTWMRALRGADVFPLVALDSLPMKTKMGVKQRPDFTVIDWREFGGSAPPAIAAPTQQRVIASSKPKAAVGKQVEPVTTTEVYDDIPY